MIRTNLATKPFYNEGAVRVWLIVLALVLIAATAFNATRLFQYSRSDTELATQASRDEAKTAELNASAGALRAGVDAKQVDLASLGARLANDLIDRRTFSWTELFNRFETTLPDEVRITSVRPRIDEDRRIVLTITVLARNVDDVDQFMKRLDDTDAFTHLVPTGDRMNDEGQFEASIETVYAPKVAAPPAPLPSPGAAAAPAPGGSR